MGLDLSTLLTGGVWAGLFAAGIGTVLTAPPRAIVPTFVCGFAGRFARDVCMSWGWSQNWATVAAAAAIVLLAASLTRRQVHSPVILVSSILPLGAAVAMFKAIVALMRVSSLEGDALRDASVALNASVGKVFMTSLAIALGLSAGTAIVRLFTRRGEPESAESRLGPE